MLYYQFADLQPTDRGQPGDVPDEALVLPINGQFKTIEEFLPDYQTLQVTGRELVPYSLATAHIDGLDGDILKTADRKSRQIKITYLIQAPDSLSYRVDFNKLNEVLNNRQFEFYFMDDISYVYTGTVSTISDPTAGSNTGVGSFTITCTDPYKYAKRPATVTFTKSTKIAGDDNPFFPVVPDEIDLTAPEGCSHLELSNSHNQTIKLSGPLSSKEIKMFPNKNPANISIGGDPNLSVIDIDSDYENWSIWQSDTITCSENVPISITYRKKLI